MFFVQDPPSSTLLVSTQFFLVVKQCTVQYLCLSVLRLVGPLLYPVNTLRISAKNLPLTWLSVLMKISRKRLSPTGLYLALNLSNLSQKEDWPCTVGRNSQEYRLKYRATRRSVCSFARTAHSFACSTQLASLARSAALARSL